MGIGIQSEEVEYAASVLGFSTFSPHFVHLGVKVDGAMTRINSWDEVISKVSSRLFKWKVKTLFIGGNDLLPFVRKKVGNGEYPIFWDDIWLDEMVLKHQYPRLYALESSKQINVAEKMSNTSLVFSYPRVSGGGVEEEQQFRNLIDDSLLPKEDVPTRWVNVIPIKIIVFAWRVRLDKLPTRLNLSPEWIYLPSFVLVTSQSSAHLFFSRLFACRLRIKACQLRIKVIRWYLDIDSYDEWLLWFKNTRFSKQMKDIFEGVCYVMWWLIWRFRNYFLFGDSQPRRELFLMI
ncbi:hypothetical protein Tco_1051855 [Tanacetum coccineum]